jgi:hypothetical protein
MAIPRIAVAAPGNQTAPRVSGTSAPKFPNRCISAHIHAYLCGTCPVLSIMKALQIGLIQPQNARASFLIAMQKVVGSNPISRFARDLALGRAFVGYRAADLGITRPRPKRSLPPGAAERGLTRTALNCARTLPSELA